MESAFDIILPACSVNETAEDQTICQGLPKCHGNEALASRVVAEMLGCRSREARFASCMCINAVWVNCNGIFEVEPIRRLLSVSLSKGWSDDLTKQGL